MRKIYLLANFFTIALYVSSSAQNINKQIRFAKGIFEPAYNSKIQHFKKENIEKSLYNNIYFVLLQFDKLPTTEDKILLEKEGVYLDAYIPNNVFYATIKNTADFKKLEEYKIASIHTIPALYKIDNTVENYSLGTNKSSNKLFVINFSKKILQEKLKEELKAIGALVVKTNFDTDNTIFIKPNKNLVALIAAMPYVISLSTNEQEAHTLNYEDKGAHSLSAAQSTLGRNLFGKNVTLGIGDNADITSHIDFTSRTISRVAVGVLFHGNHTAGTMAGAGIKNPVHSGVASKGTIINQYFTDVITQAPTYITDYNMVATNNSYTSADNGCVGSGVYTTSSNYVDNQMNNYKELLHVFAAGNDGAFTCSPYALGFGTIKSGWQCAKNVLSVGNINTGTYLVSGTTSRGPVKDGRLKPEIVADGVGKFSTIGNNIYGSLSGTSMAAPVVTAAAGLIVERYRQLNSNINPKAALVKAVLCNTAEDLGNEGPDFKYGFGMLNTRRAIEAVEQNRYFIGNTNTTFPITIPTNARRLKVMLYWADVPASVNAANALVNDLDLTVTGAAGLHFPLVLDPSAIGVNNLAVEAVDHLNNIEQVVIDNPTAGAYNLNVNLFNVPVGPQEYIVTYQIDMNAVTVEYPFGGETLVPGENEIIRWSASGDDASTYSVDFSDNNGASWTNIINNAPSSARSANWVVPTANTNEGLIRVTKNISGNTDISDYKFTILGVPTLTTSVPCEGFVQLDWTAVTGATTYDVLQLKADSMTVIANVTGNSFLVQGLNSNTTYWFGVRAKNTTFNGRRSISQNIIPATGVCTLSPLFDNNFKAVSIDAPASGRQFTSSALSNAEQIKLTIKNLDDVASSGNYNLYYQINANPIVMETSNISIAALATSQYTFTTTADLSGIGVYNIKTWVKKMGDTQLNDDTTFTTIKHLANPILTLPVLDGFETTTSASYTNNTIGIDGDDRVDFKTNSARGRARTFVNTGFAENGTKAITLDQTPIGSLNTDSLLMTYNAINYNNSNQLRIDFDYKNHGQANNPDNKVWIRGNDTNPWILAYDLSANQAPLGEWKKAFINVNNVLDTVTPAQAVTSSFQIKFGQQGNTSANIPNPLQDIDDGYTFDDVKLSEAINDLELYAVATPSNSGCGLIGLQPLQVSLKNYGTSIATNVPISYRVNGGPIINDVVPTLTPGVLTNFTFSTAINFANNTEYNIDVWVNAAADNYHRNDSLLLYNIHTSPVIASFPYLESFENGDGNFYQKGTNSSWQLGTPTKTIINKAANGTKAWVTSLTQNYNNNETSFLYSPCFNLSGLTAPKLSFSHIYKTELDYDYNWVDYSIDGGKTWLRLGVQGVGINWYNDVKNLWNASNTKWHVATYAIPTVASNIRFRFAFTSDEGVTEEGVCIDDVHIYDDANIYTGANEVAIPNTISGTNWIDIKSASGEKIASINAQGNTLGITNAAVYFNNAAVRFTLPPNSQYYLDRNIVITPTTAPTSPVLVRYYFTDAETNALINANGCGVCSKIKDAYAAGITKYSGSAADENGTFADNLTGIKQFILPENVQIIPYDKGYYAEFAVSSFSEFWINSGGINANEPLPINIISFTASKQNDKVKLDWVTSNEVDNTKFIIERSADGRSFEAIGSLSSNNITGNQSYNFIDVQPNKPIGFYRLKLEDANGKITYTDIRKINFDKNGLDITVYPNPVKDGMVKIISSENCNKATLYDAAGKAIGSYTLQGRNNKINLQGFAKGMYQLQIFTANASTTQKVIIE
jgi:Subtilase family/Secretion system C-terminal sorting domain